MRDTFEPFLQVTRLLAQDDNYLLWRHRIERELDVDRIDPRSEEPNSAASLARSTDATAPTIVVVAFDRPHALARLLGGLRTIRVPGGADVRLVISIDDSVSTTMEVAHHFDWPFGTKRVIGRPTRLGLRAHVLACGDLTADYGSVVMLEDDLYVSPDAYRYARAATTFYGSNEDVAGVSLYTYRLDEFQRLAFHPLDDGFDTFFMQLPSSWGQLWTPAQWSRFRIWQRSSRSVDSRRLPQQAATWVPDKSWKRSFLEYLIDTDRYFVFPRVSLTSNCGDIGENFPYATIDYASPLSLGPRDWRFASWNHQAIRYDAWLEPTPATIAARWPEFADNGVTMDFRGSKTSNQVQTPRLLSSRPCTDPDTSFPMLLQPEALNLDLPEQGSFFHLGRTTSFGPLQGWKRRRLIEALNGEITHGVASGILADRVVRRLRRR